MGRYQQHRHDVDEGEGHRHDGAADHVHDRSGQAIWKADNIIFTTVGIDIGSSTAHYMFAQLHMRRAAGSRSNRYAVVDRQVMWRSPVMLTPYLADNTIDAAQLEAFITRGYEVAEIAPGQIDAGAVILTGEALKRTNARAIGEIFARDAGTFVCATAGHHQECVMGAHGSGAVQFSRERELSVLNVDIGGGTTKLALIRNGEIVGTTVVAIGARLIVTDEAGAITRLEGPLERIAADLGMRLALGDTLAPAERSRIIARMLDVLLATIAGAEPDALASDLLLTEYWDAEAFAEPVDLVSFSGGVAEYVYGREFGNFGDLGRELANGLGRSMMEGRIEAELCDPGQGIRATVIGASQFSIQVSGNSIAVSRPADLPIFNLPVVPCPFALDETVDRDAVAATVRAALGRADAVDGAAPFALAFCWRGLPTYPRISALAHGIVDALPATIAAGLPLAVLIDGDIGMTLGRMLQTEIAPGSNVISIDGLTLQPFDYVDIGAVIEANQVVPVTVKSLLF